jgi:hypothetical protein
MGDVRGIEEKVLVVAGALDGVGEGCRTLSASTAAGLVERRLA